jgi:hypothetical protein
VCVFSTQYLPPVLVFPRVCACACAYVKQPIRLADALVCVVLQVTLGEIYDKIKEKYAYYKQRPKETAWKNSIRHNLTVHDCFVKILRDKSKNETGKGGFWTVDEELAKEEVEFDPRDAHKLGHRGRKRRRQLAAAATATDTKPTPKSGKVKKKAAIEPSPAKKLKPAASPKAKRGRDNHAALAGLITQVDAADNLDHCKCVEKLCLLGVRPHPPTSTRDALIAYLAHCDWGCAPRFLMLSVNVHGP